MESASGKSRFSTSSQAARTTETMVMLESVRVAQNHRFSGIQPIVAQALLAAGSRLISTLLHSTVQAPAWVPARQTERLGHARFDELLHTVILLQRAHESDDVRRLFLGDGDRFHFALPLEDDSLQLGIGLGLDFLGCQRGNCGV